MANGARESRRGLPSPMVAFYQDDGVVQPVASSIAVSDIIIWVIFLGISRQQIEVVSGAFCMLRREALDEGGTA